MPVDQTLTDAWGQVPQGRVSSETLGRFTRARIERIIQLLVGFGCLVLGTQSFVTAFFGQSGVVGPWSTTLVAVTFGSLALMILACGVGRGVRLLAGLFAVVYPVVLVIWPFVAVQSRLDAVSEPWIFYLVNVATVAAVLAFPLPLQIAWTAAVPVLFGIARLAQDGFAAPLRIAVALDVSFTLILGGVLVTLAWLFRAMAVNVDDTRARTIASYSQVAAAAAAEEERVAVAGLMHDSVLAALLAAARAETPRERQLAVQMAREALTRLANADAPAHAGPDEPVAPADLAARLQTIVADAGGAFHAELGGEGAGDSARLTGRVAHAIELAAAQAVANCVEHAGGAGLEVALGVDDGVRVTIADTGNGFDPEAIPTDRLGLRGSIIARMDAIGGRATVESGPGGTTITLTWTGED